MTLLGFLLGVPLEISPTDPGLLTLDNFLRMRNPSDKYHEADSYSATIASLNPMEGSYIGSTIPRGSASMGDRPLDVYQADDNFLLFKKPGTQDIVAVLQNGVLYRDRFYKLPRFYYVNRPDLKAVPIVFTAEKEVKYPADVFKQLFDIAARHRAEYPVVLQRTLFGSERLELRAGRKPRQNERDTIVILNTDGLIVARGDDEWGATLLLVAEEYRGKGLGQALAAVWYEYNPDSKSGGFTAAGRRNAIATWEGRVHDFLSRGVYSELVRNGTLSLAKVKEIVAGLSDKKRAAAQLPRDTKEEKEATPDLRIFVDDDRISFVLYDARFLTTLDEKYIHGYGFLRDASVGQYFFRIEHDKQYAQLTSTIGLQLVRDSGSPVYAAESPGDQIEWQLVPHAKYKDGYVTLTKDVLPLAKLAAQERKLRRKVDPYQEIQQSLIETAEYKDWNS